MKKMRIICHPAVLAAAGCIALSLACSGKWSFNSESNTSTSNSSSRADASPSETPDSTPAETGPATVEASTLIAEAKSSDTDKYAGRLMTVTDGELWEIMSSHVKIGGKYGTYSDGYIICSGSFSEFMPYADWIEEMEKANKSPGAAIKGKFSHVTTDSGYTQVHLDPCVLSDLEKP